MAKHIEDSFIWRVEYVRKEGDRSYAMNKNCSVICSRIERAIEEVYRRWPDATVIKAFRGERWGNDGVIIVDEVE